MKRVFVIALILIVSLNMAACDLPFLTGGDSTQATIDPYGEPVIVLDEDNVERHNCYDREGKIIGYYQYTGGTNCDNSGTVLIEFFDLEDNVLYSYSPKFAGSTLSHNRSDPFLDGLADITHIWETDQNGEALSSNTYQMMPYSGGKPYAYIEDRAGCTVRCDLYGIDGQVAASLEPADPKNRLKVEFDPEHGYCVTEYRHENDSSGVERYCCDRVMYYSLDGTMLYEIKYTLTTHPETREHVASRCEIKNTSGELLWTEDRSATGYSLGASYEFSSGMIIIDETEWMMHEYKVEDQTHLIQLDYPLWVAFFDPEIKQVVFRAEHTYQDGECIRTEGKVFGGIPTNFPDNLYVSTYTRLEFYDSENVLQKTFEAEAGNHIELEWVDDEKCFWISHYDKSNNWISRDVWPAETNE